MREYLVFEKISCDKLPSLAEPCADASRFFAGFGVNSCRLFLLYLLIRSPGGFVHETVSGIHWIGINGPSDGLKFIEGGPRADRMEPHTFSRGRVGRARG